MKTNIKNLLIAGGIALTLASCSENSWNDLYLDGFEAGYTATDVQSIDYTLTASDYGRLADNRFNKALAKQNDVSSALAAVKTQQYLNADIPAADYIPNLLTDSLFKYFALSDGSSINLSYREVGELPEVMKALNGATEYIVSDEDYQKVYGSVSDYVPSFSPSHPYASSIPAILKNAIADAKAGQYVVVNYNTSDTDPVFNAQPTPDTPEFTMTDALNSNLEPGDDVTVNGVITAICTRGCILTDNAGSVLVYGSNFPYTEYNVGDQVVANGTMSSYGNCLQLPYSSDNMEKVGSQSYTYPTPVQFTPDYLLAAAGNSDPVRAVYGVINATVKISGSYYNLMFDDRTDIDGSAYYATDEVKAQLQDGAKVSVEGYFTQTSGKIHSNIVITKVSTQANAKRRSGTRSVTVPSVNANTAFVYDGSKWSAAGDDIAVVQPADYAAMGMTYGNFQDAQPAEYLPLFLAKTYPYAQAEDTKYVAYKYYANKVTTYACSEWEFDGSKWVDAITVGGVRTVTNQFVRRDGKWALDPSVELTLPAGRNQPLSTWFFQACVDWVKDNVPDGSAYITSYGNNDYYTGASAYQGNIDLRAKSARAQNAAAYENMTDEEIVALMKERFEKEVGPGVLAVLYPNMAPVGDFEPTVTIHFSIYTGSTTAETIVWKCVGKKQFEFVSCTWNDPTE